MGLLIIIFAQTHIKITYLKETIITGRLCSTLGLSFKHFHTSGYNLQSILLIALHESSDGVRDEVYGLRTGCYFIPTYIQGKYVERSGGLISLLQIDNMHMVTTSTTTLWLPGEKVFPHIHGI